MTKLILVVDDDQMNRELLEAVFQRAGYRVAHANSGVQALRAVAAELPDLILLDVRLGEVTGYDICAQLKRDASDTRYPDHFAERRRKPGGVSKRARRRGGRLFPENCAAGSACLNWCNPSCRAR